MSVTGLVLDRLDEIPQTVRSIFLNECKIKSSELNIADRLWISLVECEVGSGKHITGQILNEQKQFNVTKLSKHLLGFRFHSKFKIPTCLGIQSITFENCTINSELTALSADVKYIEIKSSRIESDLQIAESVQELVLKKISLTKGINFKKVKSKVIRIENCVLEKDFKIYTTSDKTNTLYIHYCEHKRYLNIDKFPSSLKHIKIKR